MLVLGCGCVGVVPLSLNDVTIKLLNIVNMVQECGSFFLFVFLFVFFGRWWWWWCMGGSITDMKYGSD